MSEQFRGRFAITCISTGRGLSIIDMPDLQEGRWLRTPSRRAIADRLSEALAERMAPGTILDNCPRRAATGSSVVAARPDIDTVLRGASSPRVYFGHSRAFGDPIAFADEIGRATPRRPFSITGLPTHADFHVEQGWGGWFWVICVPTGKTAYTIRMSPTQVNRYGSRRVSKRVIADTIGKSLTERLTDAEVTAACRPTEAHKHTQQSELLSSNEGRR